MAQLEGSASVAKFMTADKLKDFQENGFVVINEVLDPLKCDAIFSKCWDFVVKVSGGRVKRDDPTTHTTKHNWPGGVHGLVQHYGIGQTEAMWMVRTDENVLQMFAELYEAMGMAEEDASDLIATFDGMSFPRTNSQKYLSDDWLHKDQKLSSTEYNWNTQSGINVGKSQDEDDHVFSCIPKSHDWHEEYAKANAALASEQKGHFLKLTEEQIAWHAERGMERIRVPIRKGSVVFWDSRLVHASSSSRKKAPEQRAQIFVSFVPRKMVPEKVLKRRREHFEKGRSTGHSGGLFSKRPRSYGKPDTGHVDAAPFYTEENPAPELVRKLAGF